MSRIEFYRKSAIPPGNKKLDPRGNPQFWDYTWTHFGDYLEENEFESAFAMKVEY